MTHPNAHNRWSTPCPLDQVPDFSRFREAAHQERTKAINAAFAAVWRRIRSAGAIKDRDARFWQA